MKNIKQKDLFLLQKNNQYCQIMTKEEAIIRMQENFSSFHNDFIDGKLEFSDISEEEKEKLDLLTNLSYLFPYISFSIFIKDILKYNGRLESLINQEDEAVFKKEEDKFFDLISGQDFIKNRFKKEPVESLSPFESKVSEMVMKTGKKTIKDFINRIMEADSNHKCLSEKIVFVMKHNDGLAYDICDQEGKNIDGIGTIIPVNDKFCNVRYNSTLLYPPYLIGINTIDNSLYYISSKQIVCLSNNWSDGQWCYDYLNRFHGKLRKYNNPPSNYKKEIIVNKDYQTFTIRDKNNHDIKYKVIDGKIEEVTKVSLPYYHKKNHGNSRIPISLMSSETQRLVEISDYQFCIYLGNDGERDLFWGSINCNKGQKRFKNSNIIDAEGNTIRKYNHNLAYSLSGKYILDTACDRNGDTYISSISTIDGNQIKQYKIYLDIDDIFNIEEEQSGVLRISEEIFWIEDANVLCNMYDKYFYSNRIQSSNRQDYNKLYRRYDNQYIGNYIDNTFINLYDTIYYAEFITNNGTKYKKIFNWNGDIIYQLNDCNESIFINDKDKYSVSNNRIIIKITNIPGIFYKIIDYSGNIIQEINGDKDMIFFDYSEDRFFFYTKQNKIGYYDADGYINYIELKRNMNIEKCHLISSDTIIVDCNEIVYMINCEGDIIVEGTVYQEGLGYREIHGDFYMINTNNIYDNKGNKMFSFPSFGDIFTLKQ